MSYSDWFRRLTSQGGTGRKRARRSLLITGIAAALVVIAGVAVLVTTPGKTMLRSTTVASSRQDNSGSSGQKTKPAPKHTVQPAPALEITSVTPGSNSHSVTGTSPITVGFSAPLAASTPLPKLSPSTSGSWKVSGSTATFTPSVGFPEDTTVTLTIPNGSSGMRSAEGAKKNAGGYLESSFTRSFSTVTYSSLRLQQLLAQLGYLPLTWTASGAAISGSDTAGQIAAAYSPPSGSFSWESGYPSTLHGLWSEGSSNLITTGAIRAFENQHGLTMDGEAGPAVWADVLKDVAAGHDNSAGYTYGLASKNLPESLTIWHDGKEVLSTPANTGIPAAPTADGTFPVYEKLPFQVMKGTNPDGSKYSDPVYNISYFDGGDAVHYFDRGSYGWEQSLGCVELPMTASKTAYSYLTYGSLVTVAG
ncbi:MAG TPA: Ig-like domain-containing protein [Streptosporangiaceae bacterium]|nr:Ig-like domain-containing protein [Streptosporangiaceae bacterium]